MREGPGRGRKRNLPLPGVVFFGTFLLEQKKGTPSSRGKILRRLRLLRMTALRAVRVVEDADPYKKACVYAHRRGGNDVPGRARIPPALACSGHPPLGKGGFVAGGQWPSVRQKDRRKKDLIHRKRSPFPCAGKALRPPLHKYRSLLSVPEPKN